MNLFSTILLNNAQLPADFPFFFFDFVAKRKKIIVISVGNLFSSFFFHVDVVEQIRS